MKRDKIKWLIVMEGVNDINNESRLKTLSAAYQDIATQAEAKGIEVFISPMTPMNAANGVRTSTNQWIRASANYNAGVDFDMAIRDPNNPDNTQAAYKNDTLHPSKAGYKAMGESVDLSLFQNVDPSRTAPTRGPATPATQPPRRRGSSFASRT